MIVLPIPLEGEVPAGANLGDLILSAARESGISLTNSDVLVVTQKIVSKAEGRLVKVPGDDPDAKQRIIESEAERILRRRDNLLITETRHGFVCANAGVDSSNLPEGYVALLPVDPDASARKIRSRIKAMARADVAVIVSDTFGRAWRTGQTNVAIGIAGMHPLRSYFGTEDTFGAVLHATNIAIADEIAGAAELVMGKAEGVPLALVRGAPVTRGRGSGAELARPAQEDLFR